MNKKNTPKTAPKVNRALYVVTVALLFVVAVIIAVMGSGKRATPAPKADDRPQGSAESTDVTEKAPDTYRPPVDTSKNGYEPVYSFIVLCVKFWKATDR